MNKILKLLLVIALTINVFVGFNCVNANVEIEDKNIMVANGFNIGTEFDPNLVPDVNRITDLDNSMGKIWGTFILIVRILAISSIVITGLVYMFNSADTRADIKRNMMPLIIGAVIVYASSYLINFIVNVSTNIGIK